jgi:predicted nucleotidyltransferase
MRLPPHLTPAEATAVRQLVAGARERLAGEILEVRLFGSRARGEGHAESDVDVAFVVTANGRRRRYEVYDLAYDLSLTSGVRLAPLVIAGERLDELRRRERLLAADLDREGIPL